MLYFSFFLFHFIRQSVSKKTEFFTKELLPKCWINIKKKDYYFDILKLILDSGILHHTFFFLFAAKERDYRMLIVETIPS